MPRPSRAHTPRIRPFVLVLALAAGSLVGLSAVASAATGSPFAWGDNALGQLGDGTSAAHLVPAPANAPADATAIEAGRGHALVLRAGGTVWAWGSNSMGQVGDGTLVDRRSAVPVSGLSGVTRIAAGHYHSLALRSDGTVWAWGFNSLGQLGDGTTTNRRTPVQVSGLTQVVEIAGGRDMSYALRSDGTVWAWGQNTLGQLGDGTTVNRRTPVRVGILTDVVRIAAGRDHGLAVLADGTVWAWGHNQYGQIGDGTVTNRTTPVPVNLTQVVDVTAGAHHSLALRTDGTVWTWGRNQRGQLGDGTLTQRRTPVRVTSLSGVVGIGAGRDHGLAILADGTGRAWGLNDFGQLGDGTTSNRPTPVPILGLSGAVDLGGGRDFSVALVSSAPDLDPPSTPGTPTGTSTTTSSITISWNPSSDASPITYRVFRDGAPAPVGTSSSASFVDGGLAPGSTHTYAVQAVDAPGNESAMSGTSAPITVLNGPVAIFVDDFSTGDFSRWTTVTRMTIDATSGGIAPPSARAQVVAQSAVVSTTLASSFTSICASVRVNAASIGTTTLALLRLRSAAGANVVRVFVDPGGILFVRSDVSGTQLRSGVAIGAGWHTIELCGTVGTAGTWSLYRDGLAIVTAWTVSSGTAGIGRVDLGDTGAKTFTVNFDDVVVDQAPG